ncbi:MAG: LEA type 2 family protein [Chitinophagales bacterium]|nr:LEA type 2 family protein [Chitinophagales bacterium]
MVKNLSASNVEIEGVAVFYNPNYVGINVDKIDIDIFANDILVGHVAQSEPTEIAKRSNFYLPMKVSFNPQKLFKDDLQSILNAALNSYLNSKVDLRYEGKASFNVKKLPFSIPIKLRRRNFT